MCEGKRASRGYYDDLADEGPGNRVADIDSHGEPRGDNL